MKLFTKPDISIQIKDTFIQQEKAILQYKKTRIHWTDSFIQ